MKQVLFIILGAILALNIKGQVTIGSGDPPVYGALLQLKQTSTNGANSTKGLNLPRVGLTSLTGDLATTIGGTSGSYDPQIHTGLIVYNVTTNDNTTQAARLCPGIHVWAGDQWKPLKPYPPIAREETFDAFTSGEFFYLDPSSPNDEGWKFIGKNANDYYPLGAISSVTDADGNTYSTTRFYVGFFRRFSRYKVRESYSCDAENPKWVNLSADNDVYKFTDTFEDGVWMTQNLKAKQIDPARDNSQETTVSLSHSTGAAVTDPASAIWEYPNRDSANESVMGLLYTWAAATNGKTWTGYDAEILEGNRIQGICPKGWHLPSDRQWSDLENALITKSSLFTDPQIADSSSKLSYIADYGRGSHSPVLRSTTSGTGTDQGKSKTAANGGFDAYDTGYIDGSTATLFNVGSGWWTSSNPTSTEGQRRAVFNQSQVSWMNSANVYRDAIDRKIMVGVRCMKNTD